MTERPILFSGAMVRALLDGRKTQTRRIAKEFNGMDVDKILARFPNQRGCPYGEPGDRLWVREAFMPGMTFDMDPQSWPPDRKTGKGYYVNYPATEPVCVVDEDGRRVRNKSSIHMPRWASRITLEVTGVHVERLQDISEGDSVAEGIELLNGRYTYNGGLHESRSARDSYQALWDNLNAARGYGWDVNPWVWVVQFRKLP